MSLCIRFHYFLANQSIIQAAQFACSQEAFLPKMASRVEILQKIERSWENISPIETVKNIFF